jgi:L,D-transpeptidase catalytic domain
LRVKLDRCLAPSARLLVLATVLISIVFSHQSLGSSGSETITSASTVPAVTAAAAPEAQIAPAVLTGPEILADQAPSPLPAAPALFPEGVEGLSPAVLAKALDAAACARARGVSGRDDLLTVIDYSLPSTKKRLWVLDLEKGEVLFHELVAHGSGSGDNYATRFSNVQDSRQTSLGLFRTGGTYQGGNGYSLKLQGLDEGLNDRAEARHIVMHGAWYVNPDQIRTQGRIGRSWGCPAVAAEKAHAVIDTIKGGSFVFSYHGKSFASDNAVRRASFSGDAGSCGNLAPRQAPSIASVAAPVAAAAAVVTAVP